VVEVLKSDYLTTGPAVERFERRLAEAVGAAESVACVNGTAALYMAARALSLGRNHTVIVPAITFLATASAPHLLGARVVFSDVDPKTGLMRATDLEEALSRAPNGVAEAVFPVHYAGQSCDMAAIAAVARGRTVLAPQLQAGIAGEIRLRAVDERPVLSERERQTLELVAEGLTAPEIGRRLCLATPTVKTHLHHVYDKLGVAERAAAVAEAMRRGLLE